MTHRKIAGVGYDILSVSTVQNGKLPLEPLLPYRRYPNKRWTSICHLFSEGRGNYLREASVSIFHMGEGNR